MRFDYVTLDVSGVLIYGNKLAVVFASGEAEEQHYMCMFDYWSDVMLAENKDELLDAMYYCLLEKNIDTERNEENSVLAAFIAKNDEVMWAEFCDMFDDITAGTY